MFSGIWGPLAWIIGIITTFLEYFKNAFNGLITILKSFPSIFGLVTSSVNYLPSLFATFLLISVAVSIIYVVVKFTAGG